MAAIRSKNTKPELQVRRGLHSRGYRYRVNVNSLPGRPDLVMRKYNAVVFVHGCFWHAHRGCRYFQLPKTRPDFWKEKLGSNEKRDVRDVGLLLDQGYRVAIVWECAIKQDLSSVLIDLEEFLGGSRTTIEISA